MFAANLIRCIHFAVVLYMVFAPFSENIEVVETYVMIVPFIVFHWIVNNNMCALSMLEAYLTGKPMCETFIGRIVEPIYSISSGEIQLVTFILYCVAVYRVGSPLAVAKKYASTAHRLYRQWRQ